MFQQTFDFIGSQLRRLKGVRPPPVRLPASLGWKHGITINIVRHRRARRYLLSVQGDGTARLVIPQRGTQAEALAFLERSEAWLLRRIGQWQSRYEQRLPWGDGSSFLFRGEDVQLRVTQIADGVSLAFSGEKLRLPAAVDDYRPAVHRYLRQLASVELPRRTHELARLHGVEIRGVSVRAQRSRWGSCSARGMISLNWRLLQAPSFVVDYLIVHELMHRREMNHSARYWKHVAQAFPDYRAAEKWLKSSRLDLREG